MMEIRFAGEKQEVLPQRSRCRGNDFCYVCFGLQQGIQNINELIYFGNIVYNIWDFFQLDFTTILLVRGVFFKIDRATMDVFYEIFVCEWTTEYGVLSFVLYMLCILVFILSSVYLFFAAQFVSSNNYYLFLP